MSPTPPEPSSPLPDAAPEPQWGRSNKHVALLIVLLIHIALLMAVMLSRSRQPPPPKATSVEMIMVQETVPEKIPEPKPADIKPLDLPPPPQTTLPPPPVIDVVQDAIRVPVSAPAPVSAPGPVSAPAAPTPAPPAQAVASAAVKAVPAAPKLFEECAEASDRHMIADVYRLPRDTRSVSEMRYRKPIKRVCLAQLDIAPRSFLEGFPGMGSTVEWFGLDIRFTVNIPDTATWEFMLLADDGAVLSIDDENVIDNDGIHAPTPVATRIKLEKGPHHFRVRYFQGPGPDLALMLAWKKPGAADYGYLPRSIIVRPPAGTLTALQAKD